MNPFGIFPYSCWRWLEEEILRAVRGTPSLCEVRAEGWSELSPRCVGAAARRAGLSPLFCDAPISRRPVCFLMHTLSPFGVSFSERRLSLLRVEVYEALATATGEIRVWLRL